MAAAVGAKMKDENCFAQQSDTAGANRPALAVRGRNSGERPGKSAARLNLNGHPASPISSPGIGDYCFVPVKVPSPN
jgi:hypothetical protein